jgi:tetratricopeptide (TPR) repeat protein
MPYLLKIDSRLSMKLEEIRESLDKQINETTKALEECQGQLSSGDAAAKAAADDLQQRLDNLKQRLIAYEAFDKGWGLIKKGNRQEAKKLFLDACKFSPTYLGILNNELILNLKEDYAQTIEAMRFVLEIAPDYEIARSNLATAYINYGIREMQNDLLNSEELFQRALSITRSTELIEAARANLAVSYTYVGLHEIARGNLVEAIKAMLRACASWSNEDTRYNAGLALGILAQYQFSINNVEGAVRIFEQAADTGLKTPQFLNGYAVVLAYINRLTEAAEKLEFLLTQNMEAKMAEVVKANLNAINSQKVQDIMPLPGSFSDFRELNKPKVLEYILDNNEEENLKVV